MFLIGDGAIQMSETLCCYSWGGWLLQIRRHNTVVSLDRLYLAMFFAAVPLSVLNSQTYTKAAFDCVMPVMFTVCLYTYVLLRCVAASFQHGHCMEQETGQNCWVLYLCEVSRYVVQYVCTYVRMHCDTKGRCQHQSTSKLPLFGVAMCSVLVV